jgi:ParB-like chromosome segregation protein Spo0J
MTAEKIEQWPIDKLIPYARNSRTHSEDQIAQIAASIVEWGWTTPILVDSDGGIIAGHGRTAAARKLGYTKVPVIVAGEWSDAKKRAYVLADNKLALNAGWDYEMLRIEIQELEDKFQLDIVGFSTFEIGDILGLNEMEQKPTTGEINPNEFNMDHKCPKCGFEFDE